MNQLIEITNIEGSKDSYDYDLYGNLIKELVSNKKTLYEYNNLDLLAIKTIGDSVYKYEYNEYGQLTKAQKDGETMLLHYGSNYDLESIIDENNQIVQYEYDIKGRQTTILYPGGKLVQYEYDQYDRLVSVIDGDSTTSYEHDAVGNIIKETSDGLVTLRTYDLAGNLLTQEVIKDDVGISTLNYERNELGDVLKEESITEGNKTTKEYEYDEAYQIVKETVDDGTNVSTTSFKYDLWGNKDTVIEEIQGEVNETRYVYNDKQQLVQTKSTEGNIELEYDDYGNAVKKAYSNGLVETYSFNDNNQLIKIEDNYGKIIEYSYDSLGERIGRNEELPYDYFIVVPQDENVTKEGYDLDAILSNAEKAVNEVLDNKYYCTVSFKGSNIKVTSETYVNDITVENTEVLQTQRNDVVYESYTYGLTRLKTETRDGEQYHVVNGKLDIIGTITDTLNTWVDYGISGNALTLTMPRFGYSSENHDGSLQYLRARYYDTQLGIFISQDSYRGTQTNQLSQNRYIYTENNAVNNIDPSGRFLKNVFVGIKKVVSTFAKSPVGQLVKKVTNKVVNFTKEVVNKGLATAVVNTAKKLIATPKVNEAYTKNLEQSKSLKESGKVIKQITQKQTVTLQTQLQQQALSLKAKGVSSNEILAKRLELIRKYCEIYDLDSVEVSKTLTMQETIRKQSQERRQPKNTSLLEKAWEWLKDLGGKIVDGVVWIGKQVINVINKLAEVGKWLIDFIVRYANIIIPIAATAAIIYFFPPSLLLTLPTGISFGSLTTLGGMTLTSTLTFTTTAVAVPTEVIAISSGLVMMIAGDGLSGNNKNTNSNSSNSNQSEGTETDWKNQKEKMKDHTDKYGDSHDNLPTKDQKPNSSMDLYDKETGELLQRRFFDENGRAIKDIDYKHNDPHNTHTFPHEHYWDWTNGGSPRD